MGRINSAPCLNCADRKIGCHGVCVDYIEFQKKQKQLRDVKETERIKRSATFRPKYFK